MLNGLKGLRLSSRKRGSEALEKPPTDATPDASPSPKPASLSAAGSPSQKPKSRAKPRSKVVAPPATPDPPDVAERKKVQALVQSFPPRAFHATMLERLQNAKPEQVSALLELLVGAVPPPLLHCARCHHDYLEEDNYERSCVMDHDDNSTEVKHGETMWGCCGNTVDGEDTPLGWCYEGKHTTDREKAQYREDYEADGSDDGLQSCEQRKCKRRAQAALVEDVHGTGVITRHRGERLPPAKRKRTS